MFMLLFSIVNGDRSCSWSQSTLEKSSLDTLPNISCFVPRKKFVIWVWNETRVSKWLILMWHIPLQNKIDLFASWTLSIDIFCSLCQASFMIQRWETWQKLRFNIIQVPPNPSSPLLCAHFTCFPLISILLFKIISSNIQTKQSRENLPVCFVFHQI